MGERYEKLRATITPLPCPFCGEALVVKSDHHGEWWGHANDATGDCECSINQLFDDDDVRRWNRRSQLRQEYVNPGQEATYTVVEGRDVASWAATPDTGREER